MSSYGTYEPMIFSELSVPKRQICPPSDAIPMCLIVGMIAFFYLVHSGAFQPRAAHYHPITGMAQRTMGAAAGMISRMGDAVTSSSVVKDAGSAFSDMKGKAKLIDGGKEKQETNAKALRKWVEDHKKKGKTCIMVVFAHWCPHCHSSIKALGNHISSDTEFDTLLVNAEAVHPSVFQGSSALVGLEYYPTILCMKDGSDPETMSSVEDAVETASSASTPPTEAKAKEEATSAKVVDTLKEDEGEEADIGGVLNSLF